MHITMKDISKSFDGVLVLDKANLVVASGEVHALLGENGAGKSSLMKVLTGVYAKDSGTIEIDGRDVNFSHPKQAEKNGIYFVYQELNSVLDMTIEENLFLGREQIGAFGVLQQKTMMQQTQEVLDALDLHLHPRTYLRDMSVGQRQLVEIAKAFLVNAKTIILDEPTAALTENETAKLFSIIKVLQKKGVSFIYISHRMEEIFKICDRVTVMRDGKYIGTAETAAITSEELVRMMIGRELGNLFQKQPVAQGSVALKVSHLTKNGMFFDVSFEVHEGEILGVAGLIGAARSEIMKTIYGAYRADSGSIAIHGAPVPLKRYTPRKARMYGIGFITEDRKDEGLMINESIMANLDLTNFPLIANARGIIQTKREKKLSADAIAKFKISCRNRNHICNHLSGGNQQKVVFAKWLYANPRILILDEPTRGVDVGAKQEIYTIMTNLVKQGVAIIMVSSELPEVLGMSDRILVIREGKVAGMLLRSEATQEKIMTLATGGKAHAE